MIIDVLVNNAGYALLGAVEEVSDRQIRDQDDFQSSCPNWFPQ
ncbi:hypothetical protein [Nostoc sp.]